MILLITHLYYFSWTSCLLGLNQAVNQTQPTQKSTRDFILPAGGDLLFVISLELFTILIHLKVVTKLRLVICNRGRAFMVLRG
jgi:hypothetical protein